MWTLIQCLVVPFNEKVCRERSSDRRPKAPDDNNKYWMKTRKYQLMEYPCVNSRARRCRIKVTIRLPVFERNVNTHKMFCCRFQRERSSHRRLKVTTANNKNAKNTREFKRNICLWTQVVVCNPSWHTVNCNGCKIELARNLRMCLY